MNALQDLIIRCIKLGIRGSAQAEAERAALCARLAEAEKVIQPFAEAAYDEKYGGGGLWHTDYASGSRMAIYTGKINRRQLNDADLEAAAAWVKNVI